MTMHSSPAASPAQLVHTTEAEGAAWWFFDSLAVVRSGQDGALPVIIDVTVAPGGGAPLHQHTGLDDSFYLLSGRLAMRCGERGFAVTAGDYVALPAGIPHTFRVLGDEPARMLQIHADDSFLRFIQAAGVPAASRTVPEGTQLGVPFAEMPRIAAETGQPVIGPPMTDAEAQEIAAAVPGS